MNRAQSAKPQVLHPRNVHAQGYPMAQLVQAYPDLQPFIIHKPDNGQTINFSEPKAVKALNGALLAYYYQIPVWDIPPGYLCPPIPGRADYVHYIADLLARDNEGVIPKGKQIVGLDIGVGANSIYPIIGNRAYGWQFVGSDIDPVSVKSAQNILLRTPLLKGQIEIRQQANPNRIFDGVVKANEHFDFCMCNPPFFSSAQEAQQGAQRKTNNLWKHAQKRQSPMAVKQAPRSGNFAGQPNELWCTGGELAFIKSMIKQSQEHGQQFSWFSSLVSKQDNMGAITKRLNAVGAADIQVVKMAQGQKISRFVAWRF
jgi:23S rRNA (adenine1618-N6)-methyltransferase